MGKSGKGKSNVSFFDEGFCRSPQGENYDAVWFLLAGIVETPPEGKEPDLVGLCEAKCKSPPSLNPNIEYVSCTDFAVSFPYKDHTCLTLLSLASVCCPWFRWTQLQRALLEDF